MHAYLDRQVKYHNSKYRFDVCLRMWGRIYNLSLS